MYATATPSRIKTARQLGLRTPYYKALWKVLYLLENGGFKSYRGLPEIPGRRLKGKCFNMDTWFHPGACGTVGCIGGWASFFSGVVSADLDTEERWKLCTMSFEQERQMEELLYPTMAGSWRKITPAQAARALRGYLETGVTNWKR